jgi:hypothetical protein
MEDRKIFICECYDIQHQFIISEDTEMDMFSFQIHLTKLPFLKRVVVSIKYLFGFQSSIGAFEEVVLSHKQVKKLNNVFKEYVEKIEAVV